jgi:hypothetical protein
MEVLKMRKRVMQSHPSFSPSLPPSFPLLVTGAEDIVTVTPSILLAGTDDRLRLWENSRFGPVKTPQVSREGGREGDDHRRMSRGKGEERRKTCEKKA